MYQNGGEQSRPETDIRLQPELREALEVLRDRLRTVDRERTTLLAREAEIRGDIQRLIVLGATLMNIPSGYVFGDLDRGFVYGGPKGPQESNTVRE